MCLFYFNVSEVHRTHLFGQTWRGQRERRGTEGLDRGRTDRDRQERGLLAENFFTKGLESKGLSPEMIQSLTSKLVHQGGMKGGSREGTEGRMTEG